MPAPSMEFRVGLTALAVVIGCCGLSLAGPPRAPNTYDVEEFDADRVEDAIRDDGKCTLFFFGREHELELVPRNLRSSHFNVLAGSSGARQLDLAEAPRTYSGHVIGEPHSIVRLSTGPTGLRGYLKTDEGWTFIEPAVKHQQALPQAHMVFTDGDLDGSFLGNCSQVYLEGEKSILAPPTEVPVDGGVEALLPPTSGAGELRTLEIAITADVEFFETYGADSLAEMESILNVVDGIFQSEVNLAVEIVNAEIWQTEPDPFTSAASGTLLQELRNYWNGNNQAVDRDVTHLFTGRNLEGSTIGIAYVGVVCSTSVAYGLSEDLSSSSLMPILVAHELGHNLGAEHDVSGSTPRYVMYPSLSTLNLDEFSAESTTTIENYIDSHNCLAIAGSTQGSGSGSSGGGGGGGGGPVDPLFILLAGGGLLLQRRARRGRSTENSA